MERSGLDSAANMGCSKLWDTVDVLPGMGTPGPGCSGSAPTRAVVGVVRLEWGVITEEGCEQNGLGPFLGG